MSLDFPGREWIQMERIRSVMPYVVAGMVLLVFVPVMIMGILIVFSPGREADAFGPGVGIFIALLGAAFVGGAVEGIFSWRKKR